ncbi:Cupin type-1 domain-containing protein [Fusarium sp. LHS14.1]|nr:Cupin type-1 domain-containing protein [Fusarium sp. LHS14.1]
MLSKSIIGAILAWPALVAAAPHNVEERATPELTLTQKLRLADTEIDRFKLLPDDKDFVFDFNKQEGLAAGVANAVTFPALVGTGQTFTVGQFEPCSMAVVHIHPRAAELQAVISGRIYTEMVPESGVTDAEGNQRVIRNEIGAKMMTVFYQGSFHTQMNPDCEPAVVVTTFSSEDMGASLIPNNLFALKNETIANSFGQSIAGEDIDKVRDAIPKTVTFKVEECLAKCGKTKRQA